MFWLGEDPFISMAIRGRGRPPAIEGKCIGGEIAQTWSDAIRSMDNHEGSALRDHVSFYHR